LATRWKRAGDLNPILAAPDADFLPLMLVYLYIVQNLIFLLAIAYIK